MRVYVVYQVAGEKRLACIVVTMWDIRRLESRLIVNMSSHRIVGSTGLEEHTHHIVYRQTHVYTVHDASHIDTKIVSLLAYVCVTDVTDVPIHVHVQ